MFRGPRSKAELVRWAATLLPEPMAVAPERVLINGACVLIGLASLLQQQPGSLHAIWPQGAVVSWSVLMLAGGLSALLGYWNYPHRNWSRPVERLGYLCLLIATSVYGVGVLVVFGWQGAFAGAIYLSIAASKAIRLLVTSAYRSYLIESGDPQDGF